jgi:hypothetical protein
MNLACSPAYTSQFEGSTRVCISQQVNVCSCSDWYEAGAYREWVDGTDGHALRRAGAVGSSEQ